MSARELWAHDFGGPTETFYDERAAFGEPHEWTRFVESRPSGQRITFTILGEPASKANSRQLVVRGDKPMFIKSEKGLAYEESAVRQVPLKARVRLACEVRITIRIWYATERPDLDESLLLDCLQDRYSKPQIIGQGEKQRVLLQAGVYRNDRQVREKHIFHAIDKHNPRAEIEIEPIDGQEALPLE